MNTAVKKPQRQTANLDAQLASKLSPRRRKKIATQERISVRALAKNDHVLCQAFVSAAIKESNSSAILAQAIEKNWIQCTTEQHGVVLGLFSGKELIGMLGGLLYADLNNAQLVGQQFITYLRKRYRTAFYAAELLRSFEQWAYTSGAEHVILKHCPALSHNTIMLLYAHSGYKSEQVIYSKDLRDDDCAAA